MQDAKTVVHRLRGLRISTASHAADMREFIFAFPDPTQGSCVLHIQCPWRIESAESIVTGSRDWYEPSELDELEVDWEPDESTSLQSERIRVLFGDARTEGARTLVNRSDQLTVLAVDVDQYGGLTLVLSGGFALRVFPSGSRGESWRLFREGEVGSDFVWKTGDESNTPSG